MSVREAVRGDVLYSQRIFGLYRRLVQEQVKPFISQDGGLRGRNVLRAYTKSKCISILARDFISRHIDKKGKDFTPSFINFTTFIARYEQQATGEPGIVRIVYPNDLMKQIILSIENNEELTRQFNDYFISSDHINSDPDIVRVFEYAALDTAMVKLGLVEDSPNRGEPFGGGDQISAIDYFKTVKNNVAPIAEFLQNTSWEEIFEFHKKKGWKMVRFFLNREDTKKSTFPDRYTRFLNDLFSNLRKKGLLPKYDKLRLWLVGAGDGPDLQPLADLLGLENLEQVFVSDIISPKFPFFMLKGLNDGDTVSQPERMIMDPEGFLRENGFHPYIDQLDITKNETIPNEIQDIDISTMFAVLVHIDGPKDVNRNAYKQAITNWLSRGRHGALFISLMISKNRMPVPGMVLRKIDGKTNIDSLRKNPFLSAIFNQKMDDGSFLWSDQELEELKIEPIFPGEEELPILSTPEADETWRKNYLQNDDRKAMT